MSFIQSEDENENYSLSQSYDSSINNFNSLPLLNKEQILVNWLNTIKQPHCLLINKLTDNDIIDNGIVFIEILSNFLTYFGMGNFYPDKRLTKYEKVDLVISSLIELNKGDYYDYNLKQKILFFYHRITDIFQKKKFLISFLELLKDIYDKFGVNITEGNVENNNANINNYNYLNDIEEIKESSENEINQIAQINFQKENLSNASSSNNTTNPNNVHQNISNLNINLISEGVSSNNNENLNNMTPQYNNNINEKNSNDEEILEYKSKKNKKNKKKNITLIKDPNEKYKINYYSYGSNENILYNNIMNNLRIQKSPRQSKINFSSLSPSHSITLSIAPINYNKKNMTIDEISNKKNSNHNNIQRKILKNKEKNNYNSINVVTNNHNEKSLIIGIVNKGTNNILQYKIPIYQFRRPTNPIIQISLNKNKLTKYISKINKNIQPKNENINQSYPIKSVSSEKKQISKLSESAKNSIKLWLTSLKIIDNLNSSNLSILYLCHNGTLFNDIINRCSNENDIIKGIIREPYTISQCKINLKKFFDYVITNQKLFEYLKDFSESINDIINKDEDICFGILFALFRYFNKDYKIIQNIKIKIPPRLYLEKKEKKNNFINKSILNVNKTKNISSKNIINLNNKSSINDNSNKKLISSKNKTNSNSEKKIRKKNKSCFIDSKKKEKENEDYSNFLNGLSINNEFNINVNPKSSNNLLVGKSIKYSTLNSQTVSRCSSIIHSPSDNSSFLNFDVYLNNKYNTRINFGNYSHKNNTIKINYFDKSNKKNIPNLKLIKNKNKSQREILDKNHKCFLLFRSSNISRMKNETKKFLKY
jgi:hypothetical protein